MRFVIARWAATDNQLLVEIGWHFTHGWEPKLSTFLKWGLAEILINFKKNFSCPCTLYFMPISITKKTGAVRRWHMIVFMCYVLILLELFVPFARFSVNLQRRVKTAARWARKLFFHFAFRSSKRIHYSLPFKNVSVKVVTENLRSFIGNGIFSIDHNNIIDSNFKKCFSNVLRMTRIQEY